MEQITVEPVLGDKLAEVTAQAVLFDSSGRALGIFTPLASCDDQEGRLEPPLSIAETEELRKVRTGKPLDEILGRLGIP
jgi:hypothetical protein